MITVMLALVPLLFATGSLVWLMTSGATAQARSDAWGVPSIRVTYKDHADDMKHANWQVQRAAEIMDAAGAKEIVAEPVGEGRGGVQPARRRPGHEVDRRGQGRFADRALWHEHDGTAHADGKAAPLVADGKFLFRGQREDSA